MNQYHTKFDNLFFFLSSNYVFANKKSQSSFEEIHQSDKIYHKSQLVWTYDNKCCFQSQILEAIQKFQRKYCKENSKQQIYIHHIEKMYFTHNIGVVTSIQMCSAFYSIHNNLLRMATEINLARKNSNFEFDDDEWGRNDRRLREKKFSKWNIQENKAYATFLVENSLEFENGGEEGRRSKKFFSRMAEVLNNGRNNEKCRSHHQKMLKKYKTISGIIAAFQSEEIQTSEIAPVFMGLGAFKLYKNQQK